MNIVVDNLPREILVTIFSNLPYEDLVRSVQFVCIWWQQVSWEKCLWKYVMYKPCASSEHIIKTLKILPQLRALSLLSATVDNNLIQLISYSCPNLEQLHMLWDDKSHFTISNTMNQIKILRFMCENEYFMDFEFLDSIFPNLESLHIPNMAFKMKDLMAYLMKKHDSLHTLSICCWTLDGYCVLQCLSVCTKLRNLSLTTLCNYVENFSCKQDEYLQSISQLRLRSCDMIDKSGICSPFYCFPNVTELELCELLEARDDILCIIVRNYPQLQKLKLTKYAQLSDSSLTLNYAPHLVRLTHLYLYRNQLLTDESIKHLQLMPQLIYLDIYQCEFVTTECLKLICGFSKLEVLKFDLLYQQLPADFTASDVKNKNLQLMFYNCRNVSALDPLKQQHLRVCLVRHSPCWIEHRDCNCFVNGYLPLL